MSKQQLFSHLVRPGYSGNYAIIAATVAKRLKWRCYCELKSADLTTEDIALKLKESPTSVRVAIADLHRLEKIKPTGKTRDSKAGSIMHVWTLLGCPILEVEDA